VKCHRWSPVIPLALGLRPGIAQAASGPPTMGLGEYLEHWANSKWVDMVVAVQKGFAEIVWFFARFALATYQQVSNGAIVQIKEGFFETLAQLMPSILKDIVLGTNGLFYVALVLAGLLMIVPMVGYGHRLVKPERVLIWGVLLSVLFILGTRGYDLIGYIEGLRVWMMNTVVKAGVTELDFLVTEPMLAANNETELTLDFSLPVEFEQTYYPPRQTQTYRVVIAGFGTDLKDVGVETEGSRQIRLDAAASGTVMAAYAAVGAYIIFLFALLRALLDLAAMITILFFFAGLPLGFFEFGSQVLGDTLMRYVQLVVLSLAMAIFIALSGSILARIRPGRDLAQIGIALVFMLVFILLLHAGVGRALSLLMESGKGMYMSTRAVIQMPSNVRGDVLLPSEMAFHMPSNSLTISPGMGQNLFATGLLVASEVVSWYTGGAVGALSGSELTRAFARGNVFRNNGRG